MSWQSDISDLVNYSSFQAQFLIGHQFIRREVVLFNSRRPQHLDGRELSLLSETPVHLSDPAHVLTST